MFVNYLYILLIEEVVHQSIGSLSDYLQGFVHPRWWSPDFWTINSRKWLFNQRSIKTMVIWNNPGNDPFLQISSRNFPIISRKFHRERWNQKSSPMKKHRFFQFLVWNALVGETELETKKQANKMTIAHSIFQKKNGWFERLEFCKLCCAFQSWIPQALSIPTQILTCMVF